MYTNIHTCTYISLKTYVQHLLEPNQCYICIRGKLYAMT